MTEPTAPRQRATYSIPFKLDLVQRSLQPGACVAQLARQNGIYDNLLFTWRQRYRHLVDAPSDEPQAPTGCGRNSRYRLPPARIRTCAANASGSYLGFWRESGALGAGGQFWGRVSSVCTTH